MNPRRAFAAGILLCLPWLGHAAAQDQASVGIKTQTAQGGFLQVDTESVTFDLSGTASPPASTPTRVLPNADTSFHLIASGAPGSQWVVRVAVTRPIVDERTASLIPNQALEYRVRALDPGRPGGCVSTPDGTWLTVGDSAPIVVAFDGGGTACRLLVSLRIRASGKEAPGSYRGVLAWSIRPGQ